MNLTANHPKKIAYCILSLILVFASPAFSQDSADFNQKVDVRKVINNSKENASFTPYVKFPTRTLASLSGYSPKTVKTNSYGGRADKKTKATGFYHVKQVNGRWWAIDPAGNFYLHNALVAVSMGTSDRNKAAFATAFGSDENWMNKTQSMMIENGFNGAGAWSNAKLIA